jgi:hypothetical protein
MENAVESHDQLLTSILASLGRLEGSHAATTATLAGIRREIDTGFAAVIKRQDLTNGRVTSLEADRGRMMVNQAAQDAFTPAMFKQLEDIKAACNARHERLSTVLEDLERSDTTDEVQQAHDAGEREGSARMWRAIWVALVALASVLAFAWDRWPAKP